jgi:DNA-binding NtrC family response regulator
MWRRDRSAAVEDLKAVLRASGGNVVRAASVLAISRRQLYRYIKQASLEGVVDEARRQAAKEPEWLQRTKELLDA